MDYLPPAKVRVQFRRAPLATACVVVAVAGACASSTGNATAVVGLWISLLILGWTAVATGLTHLCGVRDLVVKAPQNTADFHALSAFHVKAHLGNRRRRWPLLFATAHLETKTEGVGLNSPPVFVAQLAALGQAVFGWRITVRKRGEVELLGLRLKASFPGSITSEQAFFPFSQRLLALPASYRLDQNALQILMGHRRSAACTSSAPASLEDFVGVREYRPGDNPRSIHQAISLRLADFPNQLAVREYEDPTNDDVCVVLDTHVAEGDLGQQYRHEKSLSFAAALCRLLTEKQYSVRFLAADENGAKIELPVLWPTRDLPRLEARLATLRPTRHAAAIQQLLNDASARSSDAVVFITLNEQSRLVAHGRAMVAVGPDLQASFVREVVGV
jgi:uncharacterized protein (DUF58 family)